MCQELAKGACLVWSCGFNGGVIISRCSQVFYAKASNSKTYWEGSFSVKLWSSCLDQLIQRVSCYTQLTDRCHVETQGSPWTWEHFLRTPQIWRYLFPFDFAFLKTRNKKGDEVVVIFFAAWIQMRTHWTSRCNCGSRCCDVLSLDAIAHLRLLCHRDAVIQRWQPRRRRLMFNFSPL